MSVRIDMEKLLVPVRKDPRIWIAFPVAIIPGHGGINQDQVFHQAFRIPENMMVDPLQEEAARLPGVNDIGIIDMPFVEF